MSLLGALKFCVCRFRFKVSRRLWRPQCLAFAWIATSRLGMNHIARLGAGVMKKAASNSLKTPRVKPTRYATGPIVPAMPSRAQPTTNSSWFSYTQDVELDRQLLQHLVAHQRTHPAHDVCRVERNKHVRWILDANCRRGNHISTGCLAIQIFDRSCACDWESVFAPLQRRPSVIMSIVAAVSLQIASNIESHDEFDCQELVNVCKRWAPRHVVAKVSCELPFLLDFDLHRPTVVTFLHQAFNNECRTRETSVEHTCYGLARRMYLDPDLLQTVPPQQLAHVIMIHVFGSSPWRIEAMDTNVMARVRGVLHPPRRVRRRPAILV